MFGKRRRPAPPLDDLVNPPSDVGRRTLLTAAVTTVALAATGCTTSPTSSRTGGVRGSGSAPQTPSTDENGFSTARKTWLDRYHTVGPWKRYDPDTPMTNHQGYYVQGQSRFENGKGFLLQGSIAPENASVPDGVEGHKRSRGSVLYLDDSRTHGRWTVEARFPPDRTLPFHAAIMLWPHSDNWDDGEIDAMEAGFGYDTQSAFIHYPAGGHLDNPVHSREIPSDGLWHTYTIEWSPHGVRLFMDENRKPIAECGPRLIHDVGHRLTFQVDAAGEPEAQGHPNGSEPETVLQVRSVEFQEYLGLNREITPTPSASLTG